MLCKPKCNDFITFHVNKSGHKKSTIRAGSRRGDCGGMVAPKGRVQEQSSGVVHGGTALKALELTIDNGGIRIFGEVPGGGGVSGAATPVTPGSGTEGGCSDWPSIYI